MYAVLKGTHDIILDEADYYSYIEEVLTRVCISHNYREFRTPIIESSDLFLRSVGDSTDIVRKEMYTFLDKGERSITLRPEITAGCVRSMVNAKLFANMDYPVKAYYLGPNFRYERPQKGRYRQFLQFGVECVGSTSPYRDAEVIIMFNNALKMLGFNNLKLKINSLGDEETRINYKKALNEYFGQYIDSMCEDCKERYKTNILRILDCKVEADREIIGKAPKLSDFYSDESKKYFDSVLSLLDKVGVEYEIDNTLVRGLDYYTGVVFEYHYTSKSGQNYGALGGGGHYGKLVKELGGPDLEGVGCAFGIERLASVMKDDNLLEGIEQGLDLYIMPLGEEARESCFILSNFLSLNGYSNDVCLESKNFSQMFKKAERRRAKYAIIVGENEIKNDEVVIKNLATQEQTNVKNSDLIEYLDEEFGEHDHEYEEE